MSETTPSVTCRHCHAALAATHEGPCPQCGGQGKIIPVSASNYAEFSDSVGWQSHREFYEKNPVILAIVSLFSVASSGIGLVVQGPMGAAIGLALGADFFYFEPQSRNVGP